MRLETFKKHWKFILLATLLVANLSVWSSVSARVERGGLSVHFLDVGQGDAILIESPSGGRVLIDGGRSRQVLSEIGQVLPFGDRRIDVVLATHPDADHIGGLIDVLERYDTEVYMKSGALSESSLDEDLEERMREKGVREILARRGMRVDFGDGAVLTVLFPDRDVSHWDTNDASIVARLDYGESSFLLTGDATLRTEGVLMSLGSGVLDTDVLKVGHHGSRTSTSRSFLEIVTPEHAVISASKDNSYGHPHAEVLESLTLSGASIKSTAESGTITFHTDGESLWLK